MVGRNAEADQSIRNREAVEDVDARLVAIGLFKRLGRVEARRTRPHHREMPHVIFSSLLRSNGEVAAQSADGGAPPPPSAVPLPASFAGREELSGCDPPAGRRPSSAAPPG